MRLVVVILMTLVVFKRPAYNRSSYTKFGEQFPSVREEGQAHVLNTVCIFVKAA